MLKHYNFKDDHGHPLENCKEFIEIIKLNVTLTAENERLSTLLAEQVERYKEYRHGAEIGLATQAAMLEGAEEKVEGVEGERDNYRAVLESLEFARLDELASKDLVFCRALGTEAAKRVKSLKARLSLLEGELAQEETDSDHYCKLMMIQRTALEEMVGMYERDRVLPSVVSFYRIATTALEHSTPSDTGDTVAKCVGCGGSGLSQCSKNHCEYYGYDVGLGCGLDKITGCVFEEKRPCPTCKPTGGE